MPRALLTAKQAAFAAEYLLDRNATQAAIRAGYSAKSAGRIAVELLTKSHVVAAVMDLQQACATRVALDADYVLRNLTEIAERCMQRAPVVGRVAGQTVHAQDAAGRAVWQFDAKGALGAFHLLGQHLGLYTKKVEHSSDPERPLAVAVTHRIIDPTHAHG